VIGASGAISGVFGAVLMLLRSSARLSSLLPVAGIWIALNVFFGYFGATPGRVASRSPGRPISAASSTAWSPSAFFVPRRRREPRRLRRYIGHGRQALPFRRTSSPMPSS
jgi:membrane associated rhomboid family serine protease